MAIKIQGTPIINDETSYVDLAGSTAVKVPVGTDAERPTGTAGQIRYNSTDGVFEGYNGNSWSQLGIPGEAGDSATVSETAPSSPAAGELWWDSSSGSLKIYYDDGTSQQWVDASPTLQSNFVQDDANIIDAPTATSPINDAEIFENTEFTLQASAYSDNTNGTHDSSDWQVSTTNTFETTIEESLNDTANLESYTVTGGISTLDTYYWRVRYRNLANRVSNWSIPARFIVLAPPPDTLGQSYNGGFYIGTICAASTCYYLIVAPNATGCALCQWKTTRTTTAGTTSTTDGYSNTYGPMNNADHPAGNFTATRTIGGFSDWYLPAKDELNQLYVNDGGATNTNLPAGEGFANVTYWSSTEVSATLACAQNFFSGNQYSFSKSYSLRVRAVRREPI